MSKAPPSIEEAVKTINRAIRLTMDEQRSTEVIDMGRVTRLRFSALPYCSLRWFVGLPQTLHGHETKLTDFGYRFFTRVGTVVHDVVQKAMGESESVTTLRDWRCKSCKRVRSLREHPPTGCSSCGHTHYEAEEHTVRWRRMIGHVDEIVLLDRETKSVFLLDYKTTSMKNINKEDPPGYLAQISSYSRALVDEGWNVVGYGLVYIPRDNPFKFRVSAYEFDERSRRIAKNRMERWEHEFHEVGRITEESQALRLIASRPCRDGEKAMFSECPHKVYCAGCPSDNMEFLVKESFKKVQKFLPVLKE